MKPDAKVASRCPAWRVLLACALPLFAAGCIVIPMNTPTAGSRQNIDEETVARFENGVTTRQDVILTLGEPDWSAGDGSRLGYRWSRIRWFWLIAGSNGYSGGVAGGEISREGYLQLSFDNDGLLQDSDLSKSWSGNQAPAPIDQPLAENELRKIYSIDLQPRVHPAGSVVADWAGPAVEVKEVADLRGDPNRLGVFKSLGVKVGDIQGSTGIPEFLRRELIAEAEAAGHPVVEAGADVAVEPRLTEFWVWTESTLVYFDVCARVECDLAITRGSAPDQSDTRHYSGKAVKRTYLIPGSAFFAEVTGECVDDLLANIRAGGVWDASPVKPERDE